MTFKTAIKAIMKQFGHSHEEFSKQLGYKDQAALSMAFQRNNPQLNTLIEWADKLGCKVWIAPSQVKVASGWLLDGKDEIKEEAE